MAYRIQNINPLDLKPSTGIGVSIPFNGPAGGFITTYDTNTQLKSNIINFLFTNQNERIMNPDFGGSLRNDLFEQITSKNIDDIRLGIEQSLDRYFPQVEMKEIKVLGSPDMNTISVSIKYSVINSSLNNEINVNITNG